MRHGSQLNPANRFERLHVAPDDDHLEADAAPAAPSRLIEYIDDASESIVSENHSPDIPFRFSLNPYRGCAHGCAYCYARNSHEYLGLNAGLDFETKIIVKRDAARLFRRFLARRGWSAEPVTLSGVTDCYQPVERQFLLTRRCLEVALDYFQPVSIVTKNALVLRDVDVLQALAARGLVHVFLSITTLDAELARVMEPRTSTPAARLRAIETLEAATIPTGVMVAPVIPGLNDSHIAAVLEAAGAAGARASSYILLRLPLSVRPVFLEWLARTQPLKAGKVTDLIEKTRGGKLNISAWKERMVGSGVYAQQIAQTFRVLASRYGVDQPLPALDRSQFRPPPERSGQQWLF